MTLNDPQDANASPAAEGAAAAHRSPPEPARSAAESGDGDGAEKPASVLLPSDLPPAKAPTLDALSPDDSPTQHVAWDHDEANDADAPAADEAATLAEIPAHDEDASPPPDGEVEWEPNASARVVAAELKRVEGEVRRLLENCDNKRKRKYEGTRRWLELQEDILAMRFTGPADEATLRQVQALVARRQDLFRRLSFIVGTRYRWNT